MAAHSLGGHFLSIATLFISIVLICIQLRVEMV